MFVKPDVQLVAQMLINQHGSECRNLAAQKAEELCEAGNFGGFAYWRQIMLAIDEALEPESQTSIH